MDVSEHELLIILTRRNFQLEMQDTEREEGVPQVHTQEHHQSKKNGND